MGAGGGCIPCGGWSRLHSCDYDEWFFSCEGKSCRRCPSGRYKCNNRGVVKEGGQVRQGIVREEKSEEYACIQETCGTDSCTEKRYSWGNGGYCDFCTWYARDDTAIELMGCKRDLDENIIPLTSEVA